MRGFLVVRWDNHSRCWQPLGNPTTFDRAVARANALGRTWITGVRRVSQ